MRLHVYFARKFLVMLISVSLAFLAILLLLDVVDQIRRFDIGTISLGQALRLAALNTPQGLYRIAPILVMLATLGLFLGLARSSELVVTRAAGRSALRALAAPVVAAILVGAVAVAVINPLVAATSKRFETLSERFEQGGASVLSISTEGLWLRQGGETGQIVIRAARSSLDGTVLFDATFLGFDAEGAPAYRIDARRAELTRGAWRIEDAKRWTFSTATRANAERDATTHDLLTLPTDLTRERIRDSFGTPSSIPIWDLPGFIADLEHAGFSARAHKVWLQMELALPLVYAAMVMLAAVFTMRHTRFGRTGIMVLMALGLGLGLFFLRNFAQVLGENGQIPVPLAAWSPPAIGILTALALMLHLEDG